MNNKYLILCIIAIILMSANVFALGITPGRTTFDFTPGGSAKVEFSVINSEKEEADIVLMVQGELNESVALPIVSFHMGKDEKEKKIISTFMMPGELSPGLHTAEIVALRLPSKSSISEAYVGSMTGVATQIYVNVPYPDKYAEAGLNVIGDGSSDISFVIPIISRGQVDIARARAIVEIYGALNEKVDSISTNEVSLNSKERKELVAQWSPKVNMGKYRAVASVIYDEKTIMLEKEFMVGTQTLELLQVEVNNFRLGEIAKFEMLVENKWSEQISGAYANMQVFNSDGSVMADFKSAAYNIPALSKAMIVAFWDSAGVKKGNYDASVSLNYGKQSNRKDFKLEVLDNKINVVGIGYVIKSDNSRGNSSIVIVLGTIVGILVIINVLWFIVLRKRMKK